MTTPSAPQKPLTMRLADPFRRDAGFSQVIAPAFEPLAPIPVASPIVHATSDPQGEVTLAQAFDAIRKMLIDVPHDESGERNGLLTEFLDLESRIEAFFGAREAVRRDDLEGQLVQVRDEGRRVFDLLREARREASGLQLRWNSAETEASQARLALKELRAARPDAEGWPSDAELQTWQGRVAEAEELVERWNASQNELRVQIDRANGEVATLQRALATLRRRRENISAMLTGARRRGPWGLVTPAGK
jgi:hypothetical protein